MQKQECKYCGCSKSEHDSKLCLTCLEIYCYNHKEYLKWHDELEVPVDPWHTFKLDNLKYLEQIYESKSS